MAILLSVTSLLTFVFVFSSTMIITESIYVTIEIEQGILRGKTVTSRNNLSFVSYLGIPYAKPPIGELRLKSPVKAEGWSGIRNATKDASWCLQKIRGTSDKSEVIGNEDCLYLNVYTPDKVRSTGKKYAVMVFIHGGALLIGSGESLLFGPQYLLDKDIVLVTMNYRLGLLGFLSLEDNVIPGNFGLKDQVLALKWVKKNIQHFGGDPDKITIFGESAGAVSVAFHVLSPASAGLFQSAISQSGTALNFWSLTHEGVKKSESEDFAFLKGCGRLNSEETLKCLQGLNGTQFIINSPGASIIELIRNNLPFSMGIVREPKDAEDAFITTNPWDDITKKNNVTWIIGVNSGETGELIDGIFRQHIFFVNLMDRASKIIYPLLYGYVHTTNSSKDRDYVTKQSKQFYYNGVPMRDAFLQTVDYVSDRAFLVPGIDSALLYGGEKYFYLYAHINNFRKNRNENGYGIEYGASHGDELASLFFIERALPEELTDIDIVVSEQMVEYWTNFAIYGTPSPPNSNLPHWYPVTSDDMQYLYINNGTVKMDSHLREEAYKLWNNFPINHDF